MFGPHATEGGKDMKPLLGGKGANIAEMCRLGIDVPPGFTLTTEVCAEYQQGGAEKLKPLLKKEVEEGISEIEKIMGTTFGSEDRPCLLSVRSGARDSMPGMMDTVLNIGLNDQSINGLIAFTGNERFAWDSYRRFIQMYGDVVMKINNLTDEVEDVFEHALALKKAKKHLRSDQELTVQDLQEIVEEFKLIIRKLTKQDFPTDPWEQLWNCMLAVFDSWYTPRAVYYRQLHDIPEEWGTACNVQAMVFGNMGDDSGSGVAFTRNAATGENRFNGEYLINAQGEDVVSGSRTPLQITLDASRQWAKLMGVEEAERKQNYPSLEEYMPKVYQELDDYQQRLEDHFNDMQDLEFTIQEGKLWMLQTRTGKRTGASMVKIAMDMMNENRIDENTALLRINPGKLDELLHPIFKQDELEKAEKLAKGLPASPGAASGKIVFSSHEAEHLTQRGHKVILVRVETSPDDLPGMSAAQGILTARGGMTSHAAVVARGMGKCCISGAGALRVNYEKQMLTIGNEIFKPGDWLSLDGSTGLVYKGRLDTVDPELSGDFGELMQMAQKRAKLQVRTNADTPEAAVLARKLGATGIGLCRTEHMFFGDDRINAMREMILALDESGRKRALKKLLPMQQGDFEQILETMQGFMVTIRLLDPPLHEFIPTSPGLQKKIAASMGISLNEITKKVDSLREMNPMLGHRGCRLGNTFPEITRMQVRAVVQAALKLKAKGIHTRPEIMIPLVGHVNEFNMQKEIALDEMKQVFEEQNDTIECPIGTMIEVPRAALVAEQIAQQAEFFSFGTNDLTQMTFGYSRDDIGSFLPVYLKKGILHYDPFVVLDREGVGQLVKMAVTKGKQVNSNLEAGICGEHGGEPSSVEFCNQIGLDYVSCSPYRVPIAIMAAAQAQIKQGSNGT
jgi:pyruvate,orthophosphate dikinase